MVDADLMPRRDAFEDESIYEGNRSYIIAILRASKENPFFAIGQVMIHAIIAREAQKKVEKLLGPSAEDLRSWLESNQPDSDFYKDVLERFETEDDAPDLETITRQKRNV